MRRTNGLALAFFVAAGVAGAALGVMGDRWLVRERLERQWQDPRAGLDSILDHRNIVYDSLMAPVRPGLDSLGAATRQRIRQLLTPEQQATYDQMLREREEARRQEKKP